MMENVHADMAVVGGNIITIDPSRPKAQSVAIKFGKILAVGQDNEIEPLIGPDTSLIDAHGKTIIPGLIDAHCHVMFAGRLESQVNCSPAAVSSITDVKKAITERAKITPKGEWICGFGYDDTKIAEKRHIRRNDLDELTREHPIWIRHVSANVATLNSQGLKLARLTKDSPDPIGGSYGHDEGTGELNGLLYSAAQNMFVRGRNPLIPYPNQEQDRQTIKLMCNRAAGLGITSFADAMVDPVTLKAFQSALVNKELTIRTYLMVFVDYLEDLINSGLQTGFGNAMLRLGPIKIIADGAIAGRTAYLSEPYEGTENDHGILAIDPDVLKKQILMAHKAGFQLAVHGNGDKCIELILDAYEEALQKYPRKNHRHRIEHCTVVNPDILARMKKLEIMAIPFGSYIYYHGEKMIYYGPKRLSMMFAHRSFLDAGIPIAGSSDHACVPWSPLDGIQSCVTRISQKGDLLGPEQKITPEEALRLYTMGGAYASFEEESKGSIEAGKLADIVLLEQDPTQVEPETIKDIQVHMTIVGGNVVFQRY